MSIQIRRIIGCFLVKLKYAILKWIDESERNRNENDKN